MFEEQVWKRVTPKEPADSAKPSEVDPSKAEGEVQWERKEKDAPRATAKVPKLETAYCLRTENYRDDMNPPSLSIKGSQICADMLDYCSGSKPLNLAALIPTDGSLRLIEDEYNRFYHAGNMGAYKHDLLIAAGGNTQLREQIEEAYAAAPKFVPRSDSVPAFSAYRRSYNEVPQTELEKTLQETVAVNPSWGDVNLTKFREHYPLIDRTAREHGIDPLLAVALYRYENNFNESEPSPAGAVGLCQVLPSTASLMDSSVSAEDLLDPATNVRVSCMYLALLYDRIEEKLSRAGFPRDLSEEEIIRLVAIGYNAGEGKAISIIDSLDRYRPSEVVAHVRATDGYKQSDDLADAVWNAYSLLKAARDRGVSVAVETE